MHSAAVITKPRNVAASQSPTKAVTKKKKVKRSERTTLSPKKDKSKKNKKIKKKAVKEGAGSVITISTSDVSEDSTLSGRFDNSAILSSPPGNTNKPKLSIKKKKKKSSAKKTQDERVSSLLKKDRWQSSELDAQESATVDNPGIEIDDAIQVGFAVLRALKGDNASDEVEETPGPRKKRSGKKDNILNSLRHIMVEDGKRAESEGSDDALDTVQEILTDKHVKLNRSMSTKSFDTAPSVPSRTMSNGSLCEDIVKALRNTDVPTGNFNGNNSIPSLVDIDSPDSDRIFLATDPNSLYPAVQQLSIQSKETSERRKKKSGRSGSLSRSSRTSASVSPGRRKRLSLSSKQCKKGTSPSPDGRRRRSRSRSNDKARSRSLTSEKIGTKKNAKSAKSKEKRRSKAYISADDEIIEVKKPKSFSRRESRKVKSERMLNVDDRSLSLDTKILKSKKRREYRKAQSERVLDIGDRSSSNRSSLNVEKPKSMSRRECRKAKSERILVSEDHSSSNRSSLQIDKPRSMTRREYRKAQSERHLHADDHSISNQSASSKLSHHLASPGRKGRRPRSERSLGASIRSSRSTWTDHEGTIAEESEADESQFDANDRRGRRPDRAPHQRSHSVDGASMKLSTSRPKLSRSTVSPSLLSISGNQWGSMRNISQASEPRPSLVKSQLKSLRSLAPSVTSTPTGSMRDLFRRKDRYMDIEGTESSAIAASAEETLKVTRSQSLVIEPCRSPEELKNLPTVGPLPPPAPISTPPMTQSLKPSMKDSIPYSSPFSTEPHRKKSRSKSPGMPSCQPTKALSMSHIDYVASPSYPSRHSRRLSGDAAVASMAWEPSSAPATKSPRRAKKSKKLKQLLHMNAKTPLAEQEEEEEEEEDILIPLHFLDAKKEIAKK